eukprot:scaffold178031_cov28-Tisochrysis_lutea.AAC.3
MPPVPKRPLHAVAGPSSVAASVTFSALPPSSAAGLSAGGEAGGGANKGADAAARQLILQKSGHRSARGIARARRSSPPAARRPCLAGEPLTISTSASASPGRSVPAVSLPSSSTGSESSGSAWDAWG